MIAEFIFRSLWELMIGKQCIYFSIKLFKRDMKVAIPTTYCDPKKKMSGFWNSIFSWIFLRFFWYFGWENIRIISFFFPHVKSIFRPLLQRISSKNWFFEVLKMVKKWHLTWKFLIFSNIFKWVFWVSGFGFKISEAMFSTNQNVIWTYFEWFRAIWKWRIFSKISHTSEDNTRFLRIIFGGKTLQMTLSNFSKEYLTWLRN